MGWTNSQAQTIVGLAFTYFTTTVLFSVGSTVTFGAGSTVESEVDFELNSGAGILFDGDTLLTRDAAGALAVNGVGLVPAASMYLNSNGFADTTTGAAYATVAGPTQSFTKIGATSGISVIMNASCYSTGANTGVRFGIEANGTTRDITQMVLNTANVHVPLSGVTIGWVGLAPGTYTFTPKWLRYLGAGTLTIDSNDVISMIIAEC